MKHFNNAFCFSKVVSPETLEHLSPFVEDLLRSLFTVQVEVQTTTPAFGEKSKKEWTSEIRLKFPILEEYLQERIQRIITDEVDKKMGKYEITITPTLKQY